MTIKMIFEDRDKKYGMSLWDHFRSWTNSEWGR